MRLCLTSTVSSIVLLLLVSLQRGRMVGGRGGLRAQTDVWPLFANVFRSLLVPATQSFFYPFRFEVVAEKRKYWMVEFYIGAR